MPTITRYKAHPYPWIAKRSDNIHYLLNAESFLSLIPSHWNNTRVFFVDKKNARVRFSNVLAIMMDVHRPLQKERELAVDLRQGSVSSRLVSQ